MKLRFLWVASVLASNLGCGADDEMVPTPDDVVVIDDAPDPQDAVDAPSVIDAPTPGDDAAPDAAAPLDATDAADDVAMDAPETDSTSAIDRPPVDTSPDRPVAVDARADATVTRPAGLPAWVTFTPTGGGVVLPVGAPLGTAAPRTVRNESIRTTIVLRTPGVYDFGNVMHVWAGTGRCIQLENQPPILHIASSNVTVRNFGYRNAPDGIHIGAAVGMGQGYNNQARVENVVLDHVYGYACEDALTTQYNTWRITIENSWFHGNPTVAERDKLLQLNFGNDLRIAGTTFVNSPRCVRFKGGARITVEASLFDGCDDAVRGDTLDVLGLIPTTHSDLWSRGNTYRAYNRTFSAIGNITIYSEGDTLTSGRRQQEMSGGRVVYR